jgi:uncharacterized protein (DUF1778 family)
MATKKMKLSKKEIAAWKKLKKVTLWVTNEDMEAFIKVLKRPPKPNKAMKKAVKRYKASLVQW